VNKLSLTILGTATSQGVPVIGCSCPACRSSDPRDNRLRNSALFSLGDEEVVIDTGPDFRQQMLRSSRGHLAGVLYSHEHNDHVAGIDDLRPYCFRQREDIPLYALARVAQDFRDRYAYAFSATPYPGVPTFNLKTITGGDQIELGEMTFTAIPVLHGKLPILGYRCQDIAYLTDVKYLEPTALDLLKGVRVLVISCLQHQQHHSHLTVDESLALIEKLQPERAVLTHLSHRLPPHAQFELELPPGVEVGYDGMVLQ
jgi:phosphoribosyl 1,2-cyclic phosphate phosphodiesterase